MEIIFIPSVSILTKDTGICSSLAKLFAVTGNISSTLPLYDTYQAKRENRLTNFLRTLRNTVLRPSRADYNMISTDENIDTLFSSETQRVLKERKKALVSLVTKHESASLALRKARINCWKSKAKMQKYELILETQRSALRYNQDEKELRTVAIKDMEKLLDKWLATHEKDHIAFEKKFFEEIKLRQKIQKMSKDLECDTVRMLEDTIRTTMNENRQTIICDTEIDKISKQLYNQTCRTYKFGITMNIPCQKEWIENPQYETSIIHKQDIKTKIKKSSGKTD